MAFDVIDIGLADAAVIECFHVGDVRGGFTKFFERDMYSRAGIDFSVSEVFLSTSQRGVIRGLHFQRPRPQAKIVAVPRGAITDVIVDLRRSSPTYLQWRAVALGGGAHRAIYVPGGFAHGFCSLEDSTEVLYLCSGAYDRDGDTGIRPDDPRLGITWPIPFDDAIISDRDKGFSYFCEDIHAF